MRQQGPERDRILASREAIQAAGLSVTDLATYSYRPFVQLGQGVPILSARRPNVPAAGVARAR